MASCTKVYVNTCLRLCIFAVATRADVQDEISQLLKKRKLVAVATRADVQDEIL